MLVLIDNYDSFTYNIVQYLGDLGCDAVVHRNDKISVIGVLELNPAAIVVSPGPGEPKDAGICNKLIAKAAEHNIPVLGICLGHQAIGETFGGKVIRAPAPLHGKTSKIRHKNENVFRGLPDSFQATRYHSLVVERASLPDCFDITAETDDGLIMGLAHKELPLYGVQFHPESIATQNGHALLRNFLDMVDSGASETVQLA